MLFFLLNRGRGGENDIGEERFVALFYHGQLLHGEICIQLDYG